MFDKAVFIYHLICINLSMYMIKIGYLFIIILFIIMNKCFDTFYYCVTDGNIFVQFRVVLIYRSHSPTS